MRWDSPFVLAIAGTIAIHALMLLVGDILLVTNPYIAPLRTPRIELVDIQLPPPLPPPPPVQARVPETVPQLQDPRPRPRTVTPRQIQDTPPPKTETPPPPTTEPSGGAPTIAMPDVTPSATGVPVRIGKRTTGPAGQGGRGSGTGSGSGAGSAPDKPVSVATIKTRAMPKGDYSYVSDYPAEARRLGIEGPIRVRLIVDETGKVKTAVLLNKLGHGLDELALERAKKIEFDPAKDTDDKPVTSVVVWTFNMTLPT
ncbi:MAG: TonB family protein [Kofleriaceae bacterium]